MFCPCEVFVPCFVRLYTSKAFWLMLSFMYEDFDLKRITLLHHKPSVTNFSHCLISSSSLTKIMTNEGAYCAKWKLNSSEERGRRRSCRSLSCAEFIAMNLIVLRLLLFALDQLDVGVFVTREGKSRKTLFSKPQSTNETVTEGKTFVSLIFFFSSLWLMFVGAFENKKARS